MCLFAWCLSLQKFQIQYKIWKTERNGGQKFHALCQRPFLSLSGNQGHPLVKCPEWHEVIFNFFFQHFTCWSTPKCVTLCTLRQLHTHTYTTTMQIHSILAHREQFCFDLITVTTQTAWCICKTKRNAYISRSSTNKNTVVVRNLANFSLFCTFLHNR